MFKMEVKNYLFYVRKYSICTNDYELYVYSCITADPFHVMGEMLYRSLEHIKRIDFIECTEGKLAFWKEKGKTINKWYNKY